MGHLPLGSFLILPSPNKFARRLTLSSIYYTTSPDLPMYVVYTPLHAVSHGDKYPDHGDPTPFGGRVSTSHPFRDSAGSYRKA